MRWSLLRTVLLLLALISSSARDGKAQVRVDDAVPRKLDEFVLDEQKWHLLDRFVKQVKHEPKKVAYVIVYAERKINGPGVYYDGEAWKRWAGYNLEALGLRKNRFLIIYGGLREQNMIELWIVTRGGTLPRPTPTATETIVCPSVSVLGDHYVRRREQPLTFRTELSAYGVYSFPGLTFNWTASAGRIVSGEGSNIITVDASESPASTIEAKVEVVGLSHECKSNGMSTTTVGVVPYKFDEFGKIGYEDLEARLDNLAVYLQKDNILRTHIIVYGGHSGQRGEAEAWIEFMKHYLLTTRRLNANRVIALNGGYREDLSAELWLSPRVGPFPSPSPTVDPKDVRLVTSKPKAISHKKSRRPR